MSKPALGTFLPRAMRECAPHVVATASLCVLWDAWLMGAALALGLAAALTRLRKETPTFLGQFIYLLGGGAAAYAIARALDGHIQVEFASLFIGSAIARLAIEKPIVGRALDATSLTFALVAVGFSREPSRSMYIATCVAFTIVVVLFLSDAPHARIFRSRTPSALLGAVLAASIAAALAWGTPKLTGMSASYEFMRGLNQKTGFTDHVNLARAGELQTSDAIVMRIRGGKTDYLRGAVLDTFVMDNWTGPHGSPLRFAGKSPGPIEVAMVKPTRFLFAPHGGIGIADGAVLDAFGASTVPIAISDFTIDPNGGASDPPPGPKDLAVQGAAEARLERLAREIVGRETDPEKQLALIATYLNAGYHYTLARHPKSRESALLDFLFWSKEGPCEFFASGMALLARTLGIPTRVVTGYRVVETNSYGDYQVVRDKHAHAWVEAWVARRSAFVTYDPTPALEAMNESESRSAFALADAIRVKVADLAATLGQNPTRLLLALALLTALFFGRGIFTAWRANRKKHNADDARPYFLALTAQLSETGLTREPWEGVDTFAARVEAAGDADAAALLRRYAAHRYGGREDDETLGRAFADWVRATGSRRAART